VVAIMTAAPDRQSEVNLWPRNLGDHGQ
jgi:hypothetical protein